jgi:hypothetical protein
VESALVEFGLQAVTPHQQLFAGSHCPQHQPPLKPLELQPDWLGAHSYHLGTTLSRTQQFEDEVEIEGNLEQSVVHEFLDNSRRYLHSEDDAIRVEFSLDILIDLSIKLQLEKICGDDKFLVGEGVYYLRNSLVDHHFLYGTIL